jgi:acetyl-CoA synthetase
VRRVEFADLPKTVSGKIRRFELKQTESDRAARQVGGGPAAFSEDDFPDLD